MAVAKYTKTQIEQAISLKRQGFTNEEIVVQTGIKRSTLAITFRKHKVALTFEQKETLLARRWKNHAPVLADKKQCSKCNNWKLLEEFHKNSNRLTGTTSSCKECNNEVYQKNSEAVKNRVKNYAKNNVEKIKAASKTYYEKNKEKISIKASRWATSNTEKRRKIERNWRVKNLPQRAFACSQYRSLKRQSTPKWLSTIHLSAIKDFYLNRPKDHHVDHIVPIQGESVSGLHVPWNLQYLPKYQNESKGNKHLSSKIVVGVCHQHLRKVHTKEEDIANECPVDTNISDFVFAEEKFSQEHKRFIERYEWLGTVGYAPKWVFVARFNGIVGGVVIVTEPNAYTHKSIGKEVEAQITRGATASWTPKNLGSKLVMFSCNKMVKNTSKKVFFGYSDHDAGEIGTIYQACNFDYLGSYFGAVVKYELPSGKMVSSRYFTKTSTFKRYAKEFNIEWSCKWNKPNGYMDKKLIPHLLLDLFRKKGNKEKSVCNQVIQSRKGKYVIFMGNRRERAKLKNEYLNIFKKFEEYPKRALNQP